jgi:exodeoxyribonuclease III
VRGPKLSRRADRVAGLQRRRHGQKGFNGVAILSKRPFDEVVRALPGDDGDVQARYLEAVIPGEHSVVRVASIYLPNGNPPGSDKFAYKLAWMDRLAAMRRPPGA